MISVYIDCLYPQTRIYQGISIISLACYFTNYYSAGFASPLCKCPTFFSHFIQSPCSVSDLEIFEMLMWFKCSQILPGPSCMYGECKMDCWLFFYHVALRHLKYSVRSSAAIFFYQLKTTIIVFKVIFFSMLVSICKYKWMISKSSNYCVILSFKYKCPFCLHKPVLPCLTLISISCPGSC